MKLYTSIAGQDWIDLTEYDSDFNTLPSEMKNLNRPSIIVDKDKYIWVMGGDTPLNAAGTVGHYRDIWRGRMNKMTFKPIADQ